MTAYFDLDKRSSSHDNYCNDPASSAAIPQDQEQNGMKRSLGRRHSLTTYSTTLEQQQQGLTQSSFSSHFSTSALSEDNCDNHESTLNHQENMAVETRRSSQNDDFQSRRQRSQSLSSSRYHTNMDSNKGSHPDSEPVGSSAGPEQETGVEFHVSRRRSVMRQSINEGSTSRRSSVISNFSASADTMKRRKEDNLLMLQEDLINEVRECCMAESKGSFKHVIDEWGSKSVKSCFLNEQELLVREEKLEHDSLEGLQITNAVRNFIHSLPLRYPLSVESPSEVMLHMRSLSLADRYPTRPCVHVANIDHSQELNQFAFRPSEHGMSNLKRITIAVVHTLGFMEFLMGILVSGGNDLLDIDFATSSEKIVLVSRRDLFSLLFISAKKSLFSKIQCLLRFV